jgi:hypothetical protein
MSTGLATARSSFELGLAPVADAFHTSAVSRVVSMKNHNRVRFIMFWGVGTTGTSTIQVEACDDTTPANHTAIPFWYRVTAVGAAPGAITAAAAAGVNTTAGSNQVVEVEVPAENLTALGYGFVRLITTEVASAAVLGGILVELLEPRFPAAVQTVSTT